MSDAEKELALEFVKYMTSDEVQTKIFKEVGANPCTTTLDLNALAEGSDEKTKLLAEACSQANDAEYVNCNNRFYMGNRYCKCDR